MMKLHFDFDKTDFPHLQQLQSGNLTDKEAVKILLAEPFIRQIRRETTYQFVTDLPEKKVYIKILIPGANALPTPPKNKDVSQSFTKFGFESHYELVVGGDYRPQCLFVVEIPIAYRR